VRAVKRLGIFFHPNGGAARALADEVQQRAAAQGVDSWISSPLDQDAIVKNLPGTELLLCLGGDGTVLSAARSVLPRSVPILGVNLGRLGFLCDLAPEETLNRLPEIFLERYRIEHLAMLQAELPATAEAPCVEMHALNDVTVARGNVVRPIYISVGVDGVHVVRVRADGIIVATATGSTGYNLSAGGPVLPPNSQEIIVTAVAPHLSRIRPLVLPPSSRLTIQVDFDHQAIISVDGQLNRPLTSGDVIRVQLSPYRAQLVRLASTAHFYSRLNHYLDSAIRD
jgi:NAD+ kinase